MRIYEELFIVKPDAAEEEIDQVVEQVTQVVSGSGGAIDKVEKWGVRKLAYRVAKHEEGHYILVQFSASPDTVKEIERRLRVTDVVLKFLTVRLDEKQKKIDKRKLQREKRAARRPAPPVPVPEAPGPAEAAAPVPGEPVGERE